MFTYGLVSTCYSNNEERSARSIIGFQNSRNFHNLRSYFPGGQAFVPSPQIFEPQIRG